MFEEAKPVIDDSLIKPQPKLQMKKTITEKK